MSIIKKMKTKENSILQNRSKQETIIFRIVFIIFCLYAALLVFPFAWLVVNSLKTSMEYQINNPFSLPSVWQFSNYKKTFELLVVNDTGFFGMVLNSIWYTVGTTTISIICCSATAYCIAKYNFMLKKLLYGTAIFVMIIPIVGALPAQYKLNNQLGITDSPLFLVTSTGGFGFNFIVLYGFFQSVSNSYGEAAKIDGAGHQVVFWKIIMPQAMAPVLSLAILSAIGAWNNYMTPLLYLPSYPTLASGLYEYESNMMRVANYPVYFAGILLSMLPILIIFIIFQKTIMQNVSAGGLKG